MQFFVHISHTRHITESAAKFRFRMTLLFEPGHETLQHGRAHQRKKVVKHRNCLPASRIEALRALSWTAHTRQPSCKLPTRSMLPAVPTRKGTQPTQPAYKKLVLGLPRCPSKCGRAAVVHSSAQSCESYEAWAGDSVCGPNVARRMRQRPKMTTPAAPRQTSQVLQRMVLTPSLPPKPDVSASWADQGISRSRRTMHSTTVAIDVEAVMSKGCIMESSW